MPNINIYSSEDVKHLILQDKIVLIMNEKTSRDVLFSDKNKIAEE